MKLLSCHIENFGRLQDLDLDFRSGLHTILEENGWGKSTLSAFLLVMFYGFTNERKRSLVENERKRYAPWQGGAYGGTVTFEWKDRLYRLERLFGTKDAAEDTMQTYDAETNLPVDLFAEIPGEELFAIDRDSFCRTVFIAQQDAGTEATPGIQAKIGHLEGESADLADYRLVQEKLKKEMDRLTPDRKTGLVKQLAQQIAEEEVEVRRIPQQEETLRQVEESRDGYRREKEEKEKELEQKVEQLRHLSVSRERLLRYTLTADEESRLRELDTTFRKGVPEERDLEDAETCLREIRRLRTEYDDIQFGKEEKEEEGPKDNRSPVLEALVFGLFVSGLMCFFFNKYIAIALLAAAILLALWKGKKDKESGLPDRQLELREPWQKKYLYRDRIQKAALEEKREEIRETEGELLGFLQRFYPECTEEDDLSRLLQRLQYELEEYDGLVAKEEEAEAMRREEAARVEETSTWQMVGETPDGITPESLEAEIADVKESLVSLEQVLHQYDREAESLREELDRLQEIEETLEEKQELLEENRHRYEIVRQTAGFLSEARARFTARYMEPIKDSFDRYYALLSGNDARVYQLDADLNIQAREAGALRDTAFLSEGYQDLIGLCRRLAMVDAMYEEEKPFLILDDPFVNLDDSRMENAKAFLRKVSERYQVLYFTCHESRVP